MIQEYHKSRIRVHMGVPVLGVADTGFQLGYRYFTEAGTLEFRLNNLQPIEEANLTGVPISTIGVTGRPAVNDTITATINGVPVTYTITPADVAQGASATTFIAQNLATSICQTGVGVSAAAAPGPTNMQLPYLVAAVPLVILQGLGSNLFTASVAQSSTGLYTYVLDQPQYPTPNITFADDNTTCYGYIQILDYLESKVAQASDNFAVSQSDTVRLRADEMQARIRLYTYWRKRLSSYLGVPLNPLGKPRSSGGGFTI